MPERASTLGIQIWVQYLYLDPKIPTVVDRREYDLYMLETQILDPSIGSLWIQKKLDIFLCVSPPHVQLKRGILEREIDEFINEKEQIEIFWSNIYMLQWG